LPRRCSRARDDLRRAAPRAGPRGDRRVRRLTRGLSRRQRRSHRPLAPARAPCRGRISRKSCWPDAASIEHRSPQPAAAPPPGNWVWPDQARQPWSGLAGRRQRVPTRVAPGPDLLRTARARFWVALGRGGS
jgi:hypothetical protein